MDRLDALFVHVPRFAGARREIMVLPLGVPALANLLARDGRGVQILHLGVELEQDRAFSLRRYLEASRPRLTMLSLHWHQQTRAVIDTARRVRAWVPDTRVVLGGLTASVFAREIIEALPFVDAVVRGDGEQPVRELCRSVLDGSGDWSHVPNLVWRGAPGAPAGAVVENPARWALDEVHAADLRHGDLGLLRNRGAYVSRALYADFSEGAPGSTGYARAAYLNAGRGCTARCVCCGGAAESQAVTSGRTGVLLYPVEKLVRDAVDAWEGGARVLRTCFDPPAARAHVRRWLAALRAEGIRFEVVYDLWYLPSRELLGDLAASSAGRPLVVLSPECGSEAVRGRVRGLPFSNQRLLDAIAEAEGRGLRVHCFFSAGLPTETPSDIDETARLIERIRRATAAHVSVCPMVLDPASPMFLSPERWSVRLVRRTLRDFYVEKGVPDGPGYETEHFDERAILAACERLLAAAGMRAAGAAATAPSRAGEPA
jgi:radical SAM superfamily enzyme YgiQ (UPF0313 family)